MPKRDNLKFQVGAATNTEGEQGNQGGKNRDHAYDGMAATQKPLGFLHIRNFEQGQETLARSDPFQMDWTTGKGERVKLTE